MISILQLYKPIISVLLRLHYIIMLLGSKQGYEMAYFFNTFHILNYLFIFSLLELIF